MKRMTGEIKEKIRTAFREIESALEGEPLILMDDRGDCWLNEAAHSFISERKIPVKDFMEWLMIGSCHMQNLSYGEVTVHMVRLPGPSVVAFLKDQPPGSGSNKIALTQKEREVLRYLVQGFPNKKIAGLMNIRAGTVNTHLDNIYMKLGCSNRVAACFLALKNGLFLPSFDVHEEEG